MKLKRLISTLTLLTLTFAPANISASILGSAKINGYTTLIGVGTHFTHNVFYSDQSGVGQQTENYITYAPNSTVLPTITHGTALYGASTLSNELSRLEGLGNDIIGGSNADFFSLQTGVPMSHAIVDGKILTKDASGQDAIGIMPDGTAFMSYIYLNSVLTKQDGTTINIHNINKYRQPYAIYMMTGDFSTETHNTTEGIDVILNPTSGEMKLDTTMTAVIEAINETKSSAPIPQGKIVITIDKKAPAEYLNSIKALTVGEEITLSFSVSGDKRWNEVSLGMGSIGGKLLINGEVNPKLQAGAAPRTAIGIKEDGTILLYTIDGRQAGHSYGVQLKTLANRMKELGCIEALNLDGGGSTQIAAQLPGSENSILMNKPSDGKERKVSTFFFFKNTAKKTGVAELLHLYPKNSYVLTGASLDLEVKATDAGFHPAPLPSNIEFFVEEGKNSTVTSSGKFTAHDSWLVNVYAKTGDIQTSVAITCLDTPTDIRINNEATGKSVNSLNLMPGSNVNLTASAYGGYNKLVAADTNFIWQTEGKIGEISADGQFKASDKYGSSGNIKVTAGKKTVSIPVTLTKPDNSDQNAYPVIDIGFEGNQFIATISCAYNIDTEQDGILIKVDGKLTEFEYDKQTGKATGTIPDNCGKVTVFATNIFGYTSFKTVSSDSVLKKSPFVDTNGHWADNILGYMYNQNIINGDSSSGILKFYPQKPMTRSEFASMITNYLKLNPDDYADVILPYSDLNQIPPWALNSFKALYKEGIIQGRYISDTKICADPLSTITRAEAATIVARTMPQGFFKVNITASDKSNIPDWAENGINTLINIGAISGYEDGSIKPLNTLTKSEAAKILYSVM